MSTTTRAISVIGMGFLLVLAPLLGSAAAASGTDAWSQTDKLTPPGANEGRFGEATAMDGSTLAIGAPAQGDGEVYVYDRNHPGGTPTILAGNAANPPGQFTGDQFGASVAVDGGTLIVGATRGDTATVPDVGSAYVYTRSGDGWSQSAVLTASDHATETFFGTSVAVDGDVAVVGATHTGTAGAVYVFERTSPGTWVEQAKLTSTTLDANAQLGNDVAIDGGTILAGAFADNGAEGSVQVFEDTGTGWMHVSELVDPDPAANELFGSAVALEGSTGVIGTPSNGNLNTGAAYVFERVSGSWARVATLEGEDPLDGAGSSVAIDGSTVVVGATAAGEAFVFQKQAGTWHEVSSLRGDDVVGPRESFGAAVAVDGSTAVVGGPFLLATGNQDAGAVYLFAPCQDDGPVSDVVHGQIGSTVADAAGSGVADEIHEGNCKTTHRVEERLGV